MALRPECPGPGVVGWFISDWTDTGLAAPRQTMPWGMTKREGMEKPQGRLAPQFAAHEEAGGADLVGRPAAERVGLGQERGGGFVFVGDRPVAPA